ncbi:hypothetical protein [Sphingobium algorifonticola]|uniref:Uncharacterized protein n=1 Tax=Sphingobium algorifonticola TaxID=2008318 RepID=A0A437J9N2_9SPHN|nr:hypothetical protein [Sphingobium algorifonticola]RVT42208.1 hypothetical protein ENE74_08345 [Sphingobium algorifonticola]
MIEIQRFVGENPWVSILMVGIVWFGSQAIFSYIVKPYRNELRETIATLKSGNSLTRREELVLDHMWGASFAARSAVILTVVYILALIVPQHTIFRENEEMKDDCPTLWDMPEMGRVIDCHFISIFAANPIFGVFCIVLRTAWRIKVVYLKRSLNDKGHYAAMPLMEATCRA